MDKEINSIMTKWDTTIGGDLIRTAHDAQPDVCFFKYMNLKGWLGIVRQYKAGYEIKFQDRTFESCDIKEGDLFYTTEIDGVTEIRCGEPPI